VGLLDAGSLNTLAESWVAVRNLCTQLTALMVRLVERDGRATGYDALVQDRSTMDRVGTRTWS
jgi:hypothetical protein